MQTGKVLWGKTAYCDRYLEILISDSLYIFDKSGGNSGLFPWMLYDTHFIFQFILTSLGEQFSFKTNICWPDPGSISLSNGQLYRADPSWYNTTVRHFQDITHKCLNFLNWFVSHFRAVLLYAKAESLSFLYSLKLKIMSKLAFSPIV